MANEAQHNGKAGGTVPPVGRSPGAFVFASAIGPRIMFAPEGAGSGGGDGGGSGAGDGGSEGAGSEGAGNAGGEGAGGDGGGAELPVRPDYIPEDWWDAEKGFKTDDFNALVAFRAEHQSNMAQVPETADGYEVKLPQDFKLPNGFQLPQGQKDIIDANDPRIGVARDYAKANNFSQAQFEGLIALGAKMDIAETQRLQEAAAAQREALGGKASERINAVTQWLGSKIGGELAGALASMMFTAKQIQAFEAVMRLNRGTVPGVPGAGRDGGKNNLTEEEYNKMSPSEKLAYARNSQK